MLPYIFAGVSSLAMGLFFVMDLFFERRGVYARPSQAMIVSSLVPLISIPAFVFFPAWEWLPIGLTLWSILAGTFLIWGNWFYFLVMFPLDKENREAKAVEGATELALYEGTTPALVLVLSLIASQFIVYTDTISAWQGLAVIATVACLVLFAMADGYQGFDRWSYRFKLICFAVMIAISQLIQDQVVNVLQSDYGMTAFTAYLSATTFVLVGMFTGILIVWYRYPGETVPEGSYFFRQWKNKIREYAWLILAAEVIAIASYAALIGSYTGEHVAVSGAIAASFPIIAFAGGIILNRHLDRQEGKEPEETTNFRSKLILILATLACVSLVILLG